MNMRFARPLFAAAAVLLSATAQAGIIPVANFNFSSGSLQSGQAALLAVDPQGKSGFVTDTVFGEQQQVYRFDSSSSDRAKQAGLQLDSRNLIDDAYSVDLVFKFDMFSLSYQRIFDVSARHSDHGQYAIDSGRLNLYGASTSSTARMMAGVYNRLTLTNSGNDLVSAYLNGTLLYEATTKVLDLDTFGAVNPNRLMSFFLDDSYEWTAGNIASLRLYNTALTGADVTAIGNSTPVTPPTAIPAPAPAMLILGAALLLLRRRAR